MNKHIVFTQGNKGGTGKTTVTSILIDWYKHHEIPIEAVDFDSENRDNAGLSFFQKGVRKIDVRKREGLDAFIRVADETDAAVIVADLGAGFGQQTADWFNAAYEDCSALGMTFASIGVVTEDPGSVSGLLA
jgi:MinD-like ATPase involved in chromosome partitioning or flagellar assembly